MKNKIFSRGLFTEGLRQMKIPAVILLSLLLIWGIGTPIINYFYGVVAETLGDVANTVTLEDMCPGLSHISMIAAPLFTFVLFSGFNKRSVSDFYHSLPYSRVCIFVSYASSILCMLAVISAIYCVCAVSAYALTGIYNISLYSALDVLLTFAAIELIVVFSVICAISVTGTLFSNITASFMIMFLPRILIGTVRTIIENKIPLIEGHFGVFSPGYNVLADRFGYAELEGNINCDIYSIFLGLVLAVIACVLFCKRKSEIAASPAANGFVHSVVRICVGLLCSIVITMGLFAFDGLPVGIAVLGYLLSLLAYFSYELITTKRFRNLKKALITLPVVIAVNVVIVAGCFICKAVVISYTPSADDVSAVVFEFESSSPYVGYEGTKDVYTYLCDAASDVKFTDRKTVEIMTSALRSDVEDLKAGKYSKYNKLIYGSIDDYKIFEVSFYSENGIKRTRNIYISGEDRAILRQLRLDSDQGKELFYGLPDADKGHITVRNGYSAFDFDSEDLRDIMESACREIQELDYSRWIEYISDNNHYRDHLSWKVFYTVYKGSDKIVFPVYPPFLPKTAELIFDKIYDENASDRKYVLDMLENASELDESGPEYISVYFVSNAPEESGHLSYGMYKNNKKQALAELEKIADFIKNEDLHPSAKKYILITCDGGKTAYFPYPEDFEPSEEYKSLYDIY